MPPESPACRNCNSPVEVTDAFCAQCGSTTACVQWRLAGSSGTGGDTLRVSPGARFRLVAYNPGLAPVRVGVDARRARGIKLLGVAAGSVAPGREQAFELQHEEGTAIGGLLAARSEDGLRSHWWERCGWRSEDVRLAERVLIRDERWIMGAPTVVFPPGVRRQFVRVWNDSESERELVSDTCAGYRLLCYGNDVTASAPRVGPHNSQELALEARPMGPHGAPDDVWSAGPEAQEVPLLRMADERPHNGDALVVAIDFGTRNSRVCVRWRSTVTPAKPAGTLDIVVDVPAQMVLHRRERYVVWGDEAAQRIDQGLLQPDDVPVVHLKTALREGRQEFAQVRPEWTNEELVARYFERLFQRLDDYLAKADPLLPLQREGLQTRYVLTRPVLDFNEGDEAGHAYEQALLEAARRQGVDPARVVFVLEPVAAAIGIAASRQQELIGLAEGTPVAVVDAGGGTTDVSLARVRMGEGRVSLEVAASYDLRIDPSNPVAPALAYYHQEDTQFGGSTLDCALAYRLLTEPAAVLDTDLRPVPQRLEIATPAELVRNCRRMKEGFASSSNQYLYRSPTTRQAGSQPEAVPFPDRPEYEGVYLAHDLYDQHVLGPMADPVVDELAERICAATGQANGLRPAQVARVFFVGGTNIDPRVRQHFGRAFPSARPEPEDVPARERLDAVVKGAVWFDERMFPPSPLDLWLRVQGDEVVLARQGEPLKPSGLNLRIVRTVALGPWEELDARLVAAGPGLAEPVAAARAFYRNDSDGPLQAALHVSVSRDRGAVATLVAGTQALDQWRVALVEG